MKGTYLGYLLPKALQIVDSVLFPLRNCNDTARSAEFSLYILERNQIKEDLSPEGQNWNFHDSNALKSDVLRHLYGKIWSNRN